jgi:hypothetical protein
MCGGTMHLKQSTSTTHVPGYTEKATKTTVEWVCSECDYFEDADEDD